MGFRTVEGYGAAAARFVATAGTEGVQSVTTRTGETMLYNATTKEFAVLGKNGEIVTYFKARLGFWTKKLRESGQVAVSAAR